MSLLLVEVLDVHTTRPKVTTSGRAVCEDRALIVLL
jgi:hypothetical protein